jgi:hypothetical protein
MDDDSISVSIHPGQQLEWVHSLVQLVDIEIMNDYYLARCFLLWQKCEKW